MAYAWGLDNLGPGDFVLVTELEHHSNFVPWQYIAQRTGADFAAIPIDENGELRLEALAELEARGRVKVVACGLVSNSLGTVNPVEQLAAWAHERGAIMVVDAAQAAPHRPLNVQALGCDFLAFTGHKMCGPTGIGVLWGRRELLERMSPFELGGEMIRKVTVEKTTWNELPHKFEAGTPPIAQAVGLGAAIDYLTDVGLETIERHEAELTAYALGAAVGGPRPHPLRAAAGAARRDRQLQPGRHSSPRRRPGGRLGGRRGPGRPPLQPAADDEPRDQRDHAGELLPLHAARGDRQARRRPPPGA